MNKYLLLVLAATLYLQFINCTPLKVATAHLPPLTTNTQFATLTWKPNDLPDETDREPFKAFHSISVATASLIDVRSDARIIGKTLEDKKIQGIFLPIATKSDVTKWCRTGLEKTLQEMQVPTSRKGTLRLDIELLALNIDDNITQTGTIEIRVTATNQSELLIWEGKISGQSDLYSRPANSDGISECLSNTFVTTLSNLFLDQSFRDAVIKTFELE